MAELAWRASGGMRPRARGEDDPLCHRLGERVDRPWLGPLAAAGPRPPAEIGALGLVLNTLGVCRLIALSRPAPPFDDARHLGEGAITRLEQRGR
jgi:hypothetical protein